MTSGKDPATTIDPKSTLTLALYSLFFCRWSLAITPANYPLLLCHIFNESVQIAQLVRWYNANEAKKITDAATAAATKTQ